MTLSITFNFILLVFCLAFRFDSRTKQRYIERYKRNIKSIGDLNTALVQKNTRLVREKLVLAQEIEYIKQKLGPGSIEALLKKFVNKVAEDMGLDLEEPTATTKTLEQQLEDALKSENYELAKEIQMKIDNQKK